MSSTWCQLTSWQVNSEQVLACETWIIYLIIYASSRMIQRIHAMYITSHKKDIIHWTHVFLRQNYRIISTKVVTLPYYIRQEKVTRLWGYEVVRLWGYEVVRLRGCKVARLRGYEVFIDWKIKMFKFRKLKLALRSSLKLCEKTSWQHAEDMRDLSEKWKIDSL